MKKIARSVSSRPVQPAVFSKVEELRPYTAGWNLKVKVLNVTFVFDRITADGTRHRQVHAQIGDETGCIIVWGHNGKRMFVFRSEFSEQIELLTEGESLIVRNLQVRLHNDRLFVEVNRWGLIERSPEPFEFEPLASKDWSAIEWEYKDLE